MKMLVPSLLVLPITKVVYFPGMWGLEMRTTMRFGSTALALLTLGSFATIAGAQDDDKKKIADGTPVLVQRFQRDDLESLCAVDFSPDSKFIYASPWSIAAHVVAAVDEKTGKLSHVQTLQDADRIDGATGLRLSEDGQLAAAGAFRSNTVSLYTRDAKTGKLTYKDHKAQGTDGVSGLSFAIDAMFSTDGKFVYGVDDRDGLTVFRVAGMRDDPKLEFVGNYDHEDLAGTRGLAFHPDGKHMFATCRHAHTLVVLARDPMSGEVKVHHVARNGADGVKGLRGSFGVAVSPDGKFVYTVSGQFGDGDDAVGVFSFDADEGKVKQIQTIDTFDLAGADTGKAVPFEGGNEIAVSPDGENVYAVATISGALAVFDRDKETGELKLTSMFGDPATVGGAAGVAVSPNGRFVAIAAEKQATISILRRRSD